MAKREKRRRKVAFKDEVDIEDKRMRQFEDGDDNHETDDSRSELAMVRGFRTRNLGVWFLDK